MDDFPPIPHPTSLLDPILPIEVFEQVIDQAHNNVASLRQLSLTCSAFLPRVRCHLFSSIRIRTVEQLQSSGEFLDSHPWVIPLIQKVTLRVDVPIPMHDSSDDVDYLDDNDDSDDDDDLDDDDDELQYRLLDSVPVHLLSQLPNLRSWSIGSNDPDGDDAELSLHRLTISCYRRYGVGIQNLEVSHVVFWNSMLDFARLISAFSNLQTLTCSFIHFLTPEGDTANSTPNNHETSMLRMPQTLRSLHIGQDVKMPVVEYLLASGTLTVTNLALTIQPQPEDHIHRFNGLISRLSQLSSLSLIINDSGWFDETTELLQVMHHTTQILEDVKGANLGDVRVEFSLGALGSLGRCILKEGPSLESCRALEEALLAFDSPGCILFHRPLADHRVTRARFWSATIKHAFQRLSEQGLLTLMWSTTDTSSHSLGHEAAVTSLIASSDSKWIVTSSEDGTVIVWDAESGKVVQEWVAHHVHEVNDLAFSPDNSRLVSASSGTADNLIVWAAAGGFHKVAALEGHTDDVLSCAWSPDGGLIASGSTDGTVRVWDSEICHPEPKSNHYEAIP